MSDDGCMVLQACLNGSRLPGEHVTIPARAEDLAVDARRVRDAGAHAIHLHVKNKTGLDTLEAALSDSTVRAVRDAAGLPVGVTTGAWAAPDPGERVAAISAWSQLPDFASVNWHEEGAEQIAETLLHRGVAVEAGLWRPDSVAAWLRSPLRDRCLRALVELPDGLDETETIAEADRLLGMLGEVEIPVLLHGEGSSCWPALLEAGRRGLCTRIGLEDTLVMPDGTPAPDNASLVAAARILLTR